MNSIAKKDNVYRKMYELLINFELKIGELQRLGKRQKKGEESPIAANEINRLKLHRKLLKNNLKWMKTAPTKQYKKYKPEIEKTYKEAKKAFSDAEESLK